MDDMPELVEDDGEESISWSRSPVFPGFDPQSSTPMRDQLFVDGKPYSLPVGPSGIELSDRDFTCFNHALGARAQWINDRIMDYMCVLLATKTVKCVCTSLYMKFRDLAKADESLDGLSKWFAK
jgi:hypothetical protein